jgi:hypothetical protein
MAVGSPFLSQHIPMAGESHHQRMNAGDSSSACQLSSSRISTRVADISLIAQSRRGCRNVGQHRDG